MTVDGRRCSHFTQQGPGAEPVRQRRRVHAPKVGREGRAGGIHRVQEGPSYIAAGEKQVVGSWAHLAGVVKSDRVELYVNGSLAATAKTGGYIPSECGQGMEIGFDVANSPAEITDNFEGLIDEVKVYHAALSEEEIAEQCGSEQ